MRHFETQYDDITIEEQNIVNSSHAFHLDLITNCQKMRNIYILKSLDNTKQGYLTFNGDSLGARSLSLFLHRSMSVKRPVLPVATILF